MRRFLNIALFLQLVNESDVMWKGTMWSPMQWMGFLFDRDTPVKHSPFQLAVIVALLFGGKRAGAARVGIMDWAVRISLASIAIWWMYGMGTGGDFKATYTQIFTLTQSLLFAIAVTRLNHTPQHFFAIGKVVVYAALYRSIMVIIFYMGYVRFLVYPHIPEYVSTHGDTVLFVDALLMLVAYIVAMRSSKITTRSLALFPFILAAIQFNNRRLAWASLAGGLIVLYFVLPAGGKVRRRFNRTLLWVAPILSLYVAIGWGRPEKIFKPLVSFSTMGGGKIDPSTQARDNENDGLVTMVGIAPVAGTGWGHQWLELDNTFSVPVSEFPMYHYLCHNNVLIILAFTGALGFAGIWLPLPISVYLNTRAYRASSNPIERAAAMSGVCMVVATINQYWGDMGIINLTPTYLAGVAYAAATRLPVTSGAWLLPGRRSSAQGSSGRPSQPS